MSFEDLYRDNYKFVFGYVFTLCKSEHTAEEITAEAFVKAFASYKKFDGKCKASTWLCQIARNEYFKYYKKHKNIASMDEAENKIFCEDKLEEKLIDKSMAMEIHKQLHNLKEPYKEVFSLRVFAELSYADIGLILGKSENWTRVTYHRAKIKILENMEG